MHELITGLWRDNGLTIMMVTHDIKEAFKLGTRVLAFDKRRRDPARAASLRRDGRLRLPAGQAWGGGTGGVGGMGK
jgi:NitT/TauT family transport system ATP-binding protein